MPGASASAGALCADADVSHPRRLTARPSEHGPRRVEGVPVRLEYTCTRPADEAETRELARLLADRCAAVSSHVEVVGGRLVYSELP
jgi:hypothetical protein